MMWHALVPVVNFVMLLINGTMLILVMRHLYRTATQVHPTIPAQCIITGRSVCMVFDGEFKDELCADCKAKLGARLLSVK